MADKFSGFLPPTENYSKLPHQMIEALPMVETVSELKVILYVLRHTWGFQEFDKLKRITLDEFQHGRKKGDGSRLDAGTGLSANAIKDGIARAIKHGFLIQVSDGRDFGRSSHVYQLRVSNSDTVSNSDNQASDSDSQPSEVDNQPSDSDTRSEKDTSERNSQKETEKETNSLFPENPNPPAPSPGGGDGADLEQGGDADGGRKAPPSGDNETGGRVGGKGEPDSGKEIDDEKTTAGHDASRINSDDTRNIDTGRVSSLATRDYSVHMGVSNRNDSPDPLMMPLARRTAAVRAEAGGNWADPATFTLADHLIVAACARLGRSEPTGKKRENAVAFFKKALGDEGLLQGDVDMLEQAVRDWLNPEGEYEFFLPQYDLNPKHDLALRHFGIVLSKAKVQPAQPDRYARTAELAAESQAALDERKAKAKAQAQDRGPPTAWDKIVGEIISSPNFNAPRFGPYLEDTRQVEQEDGVLRVAVPTEEARAILESYLRQPAERTAVGVLGRAVEVRFEVKEA